MKNKRAFYAIVAIFLIHFSQLHCAAHVFSQQRLTDPILAVADLKLDETISVRAPFNSFRETKCYQGKHVFSVVLSSTKGQKNSFAHSKSNKTACARETARLLQPVDESVEHPQFIQEFETEITRIDKLKEDDDKQCKLDCCRNVRYFVGYDEATAKAFNAASRELKDDLSSVMLRKEALKEFQDRHKGRRRMREKVSCCASFFFCVYPCVTSALRKEAQRDATSELENFKMISHIFKNETINR